MAEGQFRKLPIPNGEVIDLLERALEAARLGYLSYLCLTTGNPLNEVETLLAGDISEIRATALLGGLARAQRKLVEIE